MRRSKHSLSHTKLATFDMGELVPVACYEVLPGDTVQQVTSALIRISPPVAPVMHPVVARFHHWFVPYRLLWVDWEKFITGGPDGAGGGASAFPTIDFGAGGPAAGSLADYFGIPPAGVQIPAVSALPFRAYNLIWNQNYRDEDLNTELVVPTAGGLDSTSSVVVQNISWEKDTYTSSRPWPQKGPTVTLPLGTSATVKTNASELVSGAQAAMRIRDAATGNVNAVNKVLSSGSDGKTAAVGNTADGGVGTNWYPSNLYADLTGASGVDVNTVRRAFAIQRYQEARAQFGSRYTEYLRYLGVRSSDSRLQRPEYLGGGKQTITFSEVLQTGVTTSGTGGTGVGTLSGHGIGAVRSRRYRRFFEEHGVVLTLCSLRPRTMYQDGLDRMWSRRAKEDFWQKELELIGQQAVLNQEVYAKHATPGGTFGYNDRYYEYRHIQNSVAGDFRSTLNFWHMGRIFGSTPALNSTFVKCDPTKRINQVQTNDVLWVMVAHSIQARRLVGHSTVGRII